MTASNDLLSGRYRLEHKIAAGGMGEVWRATDETLRRPVAVKLLRPEYASDPSFLQRFRGEAQHTARLSHPGIASVYDYGEMPAAGGRPTAYLVMELVEGEPLSAILHKERRLSADRMLDILGQAADALQAAHAAGVIHRDVKPGNLLVRNDGVVKVTDFGIARAVDAAPLTATGIMMGTAYYVSPEQASGRPVTPASDVYSLGVVAYECLAGRRPFDDKNPITVVLAHQQEPPPPLPGDVPAAAQGLVHQAMAKDPAHRPASAGAFAAAAATTRQMLRGEFGRGGGAPPVRTEGRPSGGPRYQPVAGSAPSQAPAPEAAGAGGAAAAGAGVGGAGEYPPRSTPSIPQRPAAQQAPPPAAPAAGTGTDDRRLIQRPLSEWPVAQQGGADVSTDAQGNAYQSPGGASDQRTAYQPPGGASDQHTAYQPAGTASDQRTAYQPAGTASDQRTAFQPGGPVPDRAAYQPAGDATAVAPGSRAVGTADPAAGPTPAGGSGAGGRRSPVSARLTWPIFAALLVVIVVVVALLTHTLASSSSAPAPRRLVGTAPATAKIDAARTVSVGPVSVPARQDGGAGDHAGGRKGSGDGDRGD